VCAKVIIYITAYNMYMWQGERRMSEKMRQEAKFIFGNEELLAEITWIEGDACYDIRFMDPNTGWQNSNPGSSRSGWYYQDSESNLNHNSLVNAIHQWDDWSEHLSWEDGGVDVFRFEWDGKTYEGETDAEGNREYKTLTRII